MSIIILKNVRLSFPTIWTPKKFNDVDDKPPRYSAKFLLDKDTDSDQITDLQKLISQHVKTAFNGKKPGGLKYFLTDGAESESEGYENAMSVSASSRETSPPKLIDRDKSPLVEEDGKLYSGCYVNAAITMWVQNNSYGKRVNCNLIAIQFVKDGERLGPAPVDMDGIFGDISSISAPDSDDDDFLNI